MTKWQSYFRCAIYTTINIILYALSLGNYTWLEGRISGGQFSNWAKRFKYRPSHIAIPTTEAEIVELVKKSKKIRVVGSGHSFNSGIVTDETLLSLDEYCGVVHKDLTQKQMTFKAGTRVRDVTKILREHGLAFKALPSHDAQSIAGIISTDVHGTGRDWGFVSELVEKIKIVDGHGDVHQCTSEDDLFKAAIGGVGAVGIIVEVTVQAVDSFHVEQKFWMDDLSTVEANLDDLIEANDHVSLYIFPFTNKCQVNTWNKTEEEKSFLGDFREFVVISLDAFVAGWFGNLLAHAGLLPRTSSLGYGLKKGADLVLESHKAFNRSIYHLHQELEFAIPYEKSIEVWRQLIELYESLYTESKGLPYILFEVRFTPEGHNRTLIGAGRERRSTWIDLVCNDSAGFEAYYEAAEAELLKMDARPHLGKYCQQFAYDRLAQLHQKKFVQFCHLKARHDPEGKFRNHFTERLFIKKG